MFPSNCDSNENYITYLTNIRDTMKSIINEVLFPLVGL